MMSVIKFHGITSKPMMQHILVPRLLGVPPLKHERKMQCGMRLDANKLVSKNIHSKFLAVR